MQKGNTYEGTTQCSSVPKERLCCKGEKISLQTEDTAVKVIILVHKMQFVNFNERKYEIEFEKKNKKQVKAKLLNSVSDAAAFATVSDVYFERALSERLP